MKKLIARLLDALASRIAERVLSSIAVPSAAAVPASTDAPPRFYVGITLYDGPNPSLARKAWEAHRLQSPPVDGRLEFWDGTDCRGRYPE